MLGKRLELIGDSGWNDHAVFLGTPAVLEAPLTGKPRAGLRENGRKQFVEAISKAGLGKGIGIDGEEELADARFVRPHR